MLWSALLLAGCGLLPSAVDYPEDTGERWVTPAEYLDPRWLQVATFNADWLWSSYENGYYPRNGKDYAMMAQLLEGHDLDVVALQEVNGDGAMELLELSSLYDWSAGDSGWSQNPVLLWRSDRVEVTDLREVALDCNEWPSKDPLVAQVSSLDGSLAFTLVVVHFKPYSNNTDAEQRYTQAEQLHAWLTEELLLETHRAPFHENVVIAGDFNDAFVPLNPSWDSLEVFEEDPRFHFLTAESEDYSQIPYRSLIDHLVVSEPLLERWDARDLPAGVGVIAHDDLSPWSDYQGGYGDGQNISDHRPVWAYLTVE